MENHHNIEIFNVYDSFFSPLDAGNNLQSNAKSYPLFCAISHICWLFEVQLHLPGLHFTEKEPVRKTGCSGAVCACHW